MGIVPPCYFENSALVHGHIKYFTKKAWHIAHAIKVRPEPTAHEATPTQDRGVITPFSAVLKLVGFNG